MPQIDESSELTPSPQQTEFDALQQRVQSLEALLHARRRGSASLRILGMLSLAVALMFAWSERAWSLACTSGLTCFAAGAPAKANEINDNFTVLTNWLDAKVGATHDGNITTGTINSGAITTTGATVNGNLVINTGGISGGNAQGNLHIDSRGSGADGKIYLNYFDGKGVVIGKNAGTDTTTIQGYLRGASWGFGGIYSTVTAGDATVCGYGAGAVYASNNPVTTQQNCPAGFTASPVSMMDICWPNQGAKRLTTYLCWK